MCRCPIPEGASRPLHRDTCGNRVRNGVSAEAGLSRRCGCPGVRGPHLPGCMVSTRRPCGCGERGAHALDCPERRRDFDGGRSFLGSSPEAASVPAPHVVAPAAEGLRQSVRRGVAGAGAVALRLAAGEVQDAPGFVPYRRRGVDFALTVAAEFCALAGGTLGAAPGSFIESAALELAGGRFLFDAAAALPPADGERHTADELAVIAELMGRASKLLGGSRTHVLAAWEVAMRQGERRGGAGAGEVDAEQIMRAAEERAVRARGEGASDSVVPAEETVE